MFLCPACESHVKGHETECPHCGAAFESVPRKNRTVAMVLLGLAAVAAPAACDSEVETSDEDGTPSQTASTTSSMMTMQSTTQDSVVSAYGVGGFSSAGGFGGDLGGAGGDGGDGGDSGGAGGAGGN